MFSKTHTSYTPWVIVKAYNKIRARLEAIRHVLNTLPYAAKKPQKSPSILIRISSSTSTEEATR